MSVSLPPDPLTATLLAVAELMRSARDDWWVIASAAAMLHGADQPPPADVDLLISVADAERLQSQLTTVDASEDSNARFRSAIFGRWDGAPLPVEVMAGLTVRTIEGWHPVTLATREPVTIGQAVIWVPSRGDLIALLRQFGRTKDVARADVLSALPLD